MSQSRINEQILRMYEVSADLSINQYQNYIRAEKESIEKLSLQSASMMRNQGWWAAVSGIASGGFAIGGGLAAGTGYAALFETAAKITPIFQQTYNSYNEADRSLVQNALSMRLNVSLSELQSFRKKEDDFGGDLMQIQRRIQQLQADALARIN